MPAMIWAIHGADQAHEMRLVYIVLSKGAISACQDATQDGMAMRKCFFALAESDERQG